MKKCPYCDEKIQDDAIKCRFCGEMIEESLQLLSPDSSAKSNGKPISKNKTFLIPTILVILLPLLTISFVYYARYYENNRYELDQKKDKTIDTLREEITSKDDPDNYNSKDTPDSYNSSGDAYYRSGDVDRACEEWRKACKLGSCRRLDSAKENGICQQQDKTDKTVGEKITLKDPKDAEAYYNRGLAYYDKGQYDQAISDNSKAIEINPGHAGAYNNRGNAYKNKGQNGQAISDYSKAIEINPRLADAYYNRGNSYDDKGQNDQAISDYSKAIEINPGLTVAYINRGNAYQSKGQHDQAISDYNKAIEINPKYVIAYNNRGLANNSLGNYNSACDDWLKACKLGNCDGLNWAKKEGVCQ